MLTLPRDELIQQITIRMAAANRNPSILRGKASPHDAFERDQIRREFAEWFVRECIEAGGPSVVDTRRPFPGSDHADFERQRATSPQLFSS